jgi:2-keto-4-pentenoate hydratase
LSLRELTEELARARVETRMLDAKAWRDTVAHVEDGYAVQSLLAQRAGHDVRGWKVTALMPEQQKLYLTDRPVAGALLSPFVHSAPAKLSLKTFVTPLLECEVSFLLGSDLPPRAEFYSRKEIEAAIEAVVPAMEIADGRWPDDAPGLLKLADSMGNGAFLSGEPVKDWRKLDLTAIDVTLTYDGKVTERGSSSRILGNPLLAVVALANAQSLAQPLPAGGLRRGQILTTGTCTTPIPPKPGRYVGEFGSLGTLQLDVVA